MAPGVSRVPPGENCEVPGAGVSSLLTYVNWTRSFLLPARGPLPILSAGAPVLCKPHTVCAPSGLCWGENKDSVNTHFVFTEISFHIRLAPELAVRANPLLTLLPASPLSPGRVRAMFPRRGTVKQYFSTSEQVTLTLQSLCSEKAVIKAWPVQCFSKNSAERSIKNKIP